MNVWQNRFNATSPYLSRQVGNDTAGLAEVYLRRLDEHLSAIAQAAPDLADKCADLQRQLARLGELLADEM